MVDNRVYAFLPDADYLEPQRRRWAKRAAKPAPEVGHVVLGEDYSHHDVHGYGRLFWVTSFLVVVAVLMLALLGVAKLQGVL